MAAGSWMSAIGEALTTGGKTYQSIRRADEDKARVDRLDKASLAFQELQMKLMQDAETRAKAGDQREATRDEQALVREFLGDNSGGNIDSTDPMMERVRKAGFGSRLENQHTLPSSSLAIGAGGQLDPTTRIAAPDMLTGKTHINPTRVEAAQNRQQEQTNELFMDGKSDRVKGDAFRAEAALHPEWSTDVYNQHATAAGVAPRGHTLADEAAIEDRRFGHQRALQRENDAAQYGSPAEKKWNKTLEQLQQHFTTLAAARIRLLKPENFRDKNDNEDIAAYDAAVSELEAGAMQKAYDETERIRGRQPGLPPVDASEVTTKAIDAIDAKAATLGGLQALFNAVNTPEGRTGLASSGVDSAAYYRALKAKLDASAAAQRKTNPAIGFDGEGYPLIPTTR